MNAKGDLISNSDGSTPVQKPVGTLNQSLKADAGATLGLRWGTVVPTQTILTNGSGATYTSPTYCIGALVEMVAPGGGGGGCSATTAANNSAGAGGGGGAFIRKFIALSSPTSFTYTITNVGGAGGAAGNNPGSAGATAVFSGPGVTLICGPGKGGAGSPTGGGNAFYQDAVHNGGNPTGNYDIGITGGMGQIAWSFGVGVQIAGAPGAAGIMWGAPMSLRNPGAVGSTQGFGGLGYGGGGGGAVGFSAVAAAGGTGSPGLITILEFY